MRPSLPPRGIIPRLWVLVLGLCLLALALSPVAAALSREREEVAVACMADLRQGQVSDRDGKIGNGTEGADRDPHHRPHHPGPRHHHPLIPDGWSHAPNEDGQMIGSREGVQRDALPHTPQAREQASHGMPRGEGAADTHPEQDGTAGADDASSMPGILPWIIGLVLALGALLIILVLIPRKNRSH